MTAAEAQVPLLYGALFKLRERLGNSFLERLRIPHHRIVGAPAWPPNGFSSIDDHPAVPAAGEHTGRPATSA
ncbi:hypothetical protein AB0B15_25070 [Streptomyces sp. NPDC045456]|uniref:hypothetical protein n=1 Tax=Streptomyces sp. NPDC045456 TaxID=3155254 RepID=UPI0033E57A7F